MRKIDPVADMSYVRRHFNAMCQGFGHDPEDAGVAAEWDNIVAAYSQPHRHYHTLSHIADMLHIFDEELGLTGEKLQRLRAFAIYHDYVYETDPEAYAQNEIRSAEHARDFLIRLGAPEEFIAFTQAAILATCAHKADAALGFLGDLAMDADMRILAASRPEYDRYRRNIQQEFSGMPEKEFAAARAGKFLRPTLHSDRIFATDVMHKWHDRDARRNLGHELSVLKQHHPGI